MSDVDVMDASMERAVVSDLRAAVPGLVHCPDDDAYAPNCATWNVARPVHPLAVVVPSSAADVSAAVRVAREHGVPVAVQCTGHGATVDLADAVLINTSALDELTIHHNDDGAWARVGAGVTWKTLIEAAAPYGLAGLCGSAPGVGVVGYLLGGGTGPVARTYGLASDYVRAIEVVTGDGVARRVTATDDPDLFWGLQGSKGMLGVVTAIEFELPRLAELYGGALFLDGSTSEAVRDALRRWSDWSRGLPDAATTSIAIMHLPDVPFVPPFLAGKWAVAVRFAWVGDAAAGAEAFEPMRADGDVLADMVGPMPYAAVGMIHSDPVDPMPAHEEGALLRELTPEFAEVIADLAGPESDSPQIIVEVRQLGGALARPRPGALLDFSDAAYSLLTIGIAAGPAAAAVVEHGRALVAAAAAWSLDRMLPNFAPSTTPGRFARSYDPAAYARLIDVAAAYGSAGAFVVPGANVT